MKHRIYTKSKNVPWAEATASAGQAMRQFIGTASQLRTTFHKKLKDDAEIASWIATKAVMLTATTEGVFEEEAERAFFLKELDAEFVRFGFAMTDADEERRTHILRMAHFYIKDIEVSQQ